MHVWRFVTYLQNIMPADPFIKPLQRVAHASVALCFAGLTARLPGNTTR